MNEQLRSSPGVGAPRLPLLLLVALAFVGGFAAIVRGPSVAEAEEPWTQSGWADGPLPNVSAVIRDLSSSDPLLERTLLPAAREIPGVDLAFVDVLAGGPPVLHLVVGDSEAVPVVVERLTELSAELDRGELLIGGQLVYDTEVEGTISAASVLSLVPVLIVVALLTGALYGAVVGVGAAVAMALSSVMGGMIGAGLSGPFDGSVATTVLPGSLVALLVSAVLTFRLIVWFKRPATDDAADNILAAVGSQIRDLLLVLGSLAACVVAGLIVGSPDAPAAALSGAVVGSMVTLATVPAVLSTRGALSDNAEFRPVPIRIPDGRDVPVAVVLCVAGILLGLGLVAASGALSTSLIDASSDPDRNSARVSALLDRMGGDPSSAIRVSIDPVGDRFEAWVTAASRFDGVRWVATANGWYLDGELVGLPEGADSPIPPDTAIVSPTDPARSEASQQTVRALKMIDLPGEVRMEGLPVDAAENSREAGTGLWVLIGVLSAAAGAVVFFLLRDPGLAILTVAIRLLTTAATLGVFHLVIPQPTAGQLSVAVLVLSTGITLFEIGLVNMINNAEEPGLSSRFGPDAIAAALKSGGGPAILAIGVVALVGVVLLASSVRLVAAFGIALAVAAVIEVVLGIWLLRPVVVGEQALRSVTSAVAGRSIVGRRGPREGEPVNPEWRRVVSSLLREEFRFQTEPDDADLGTVFVEDTPLFGELSQHNLRLRQNGLKIRGEGPQVVSVKAVNDGDPVTVAITVDHPSRQLLSRDGKLLGVRAAERRDGMLWLAQDPSGRYRIAEAVDMGSGVPIPEDSPTRATADAK